MADREEHVKCVLDPQRPRHSLCGRYVLWEFAFDGPDHAAAAEAMGSRLTVCPQCQEKMPCPSSP